MQRHACHEVHTHRHIITNTEIRAEAHTKHKHDTGANRNRTPLVRKRETDEKIMWLSYCVLSVFGGALASSTEKPVGSTGVVTTRVVWMTPPLHQASSRWCFVGFFIAMAERKVGGGCWFLCILSHRRDYPRALVCSIVSARIEYIFIGWYFAGVLHPGLQSRLV